MPAISTVVAFPLAEGGWDTNMLHCFSVAQISLPCDGVDAWDGGFFICDAEAAYQPRNPEDNPLYGVVSGHLETFLARQRERDRPVPYFVERELQSFLDCGVLAKGFLRVHCDECGKDRVVAFSCRSYYTSCVQVAIAMNLAAPLLSGFSYMCCPMSFNMMEPRPSEP
jgi:hypothetical protein